MTDSVSRERYTGGLAKLLGLALFLVFLGLGLVGLILPVIPGIVFLLLACYVLTRISPRFAFLANRNSAIPGSGNHFGAWVMCALCLLSTWRNCRSG
jgi:hypothetical protein